MSYNNSIPPTESLPHTAATPIDISLPAPAYAPSPSTSPELKIPPNPAPSSSLLRPSIWRSTRANRGTWTNTRYQDELFHSSILDTSLSYQDDILAYNESIKTNVQTGFLNRNDNRAYVASKKNDPDNPSWNEAMYGNEPEYYTAATKKEIAQLANQETWERLNRMSSVQYLMENSSVYQG